MDSNWRKEIRMYLPEKFCKEMQRMLGEEYEDYLASMQAGRKYGLRVNTAKISVEDFLKISPFELTPIPYISNGFFYDEKEQPSGFHRDPGGCDPNGVRSLQSMQSVMGFLQAKEAEYVLYH